MTDKATDRPIEIETTHYLLHHDPEVIRRWLIKWLFIGDGGLLRNMRCLKSVYPHEHVYHTELNYGFDDDASKTSGSREACKQTNRIGKKRAPFSPNYMHQTRCVPTPLSPLITTASPLPHHPSPPLPPPRHPFSTPTQFHPSLQKQAFLQIWKKSVTDGLTDRWTDGRTDRPSYRDARTQLKIRRN